jgi:hypothetical protein
MEINRREWTVQTGAPAAAGTVLGQQAPARGWYEPAFWLGYLERIHADAACLSAGGCVVWVETTSPPIELHEVAASDL